MLRVAGQNILSMMQDQLIEPMKSCLAERLGHSADNGCRLRITQSSGVFYTAPDREGVELSSADADASRLKPYLHDCHANNKRRIRIELDPGLLLLREVRLPIAARKNLRDVLAYEMDRLSPFKDEEVYFHFTPLEQDEKRGWIEGRLIVAQKRRLDPWYALLTRQGMDIGSVTLAGDSVPLTLKPRQGNRPDAMGGRLNALLWGLLGLLLLLALAGPVWQQRQIAIGLEQAMRTAQKKATRIMQLQERLKQRRDAVGMVSTEREGYLPLSDVLLELTRVIPSGSWSHRIALTPERVDVTGESDQAAELITLLERSPMFEVVRFKSPVVQNRLSGKENFDLTMQLTREMEP
ncbi:MAG: PilN domain-containing protein [Candidatus Thiodiazotropha sp. (ex Epidulcina cf. delphinae)]|nr:PilN domain-containing protein [Candidatus Thiodiazotropha sp. (ex Epidulcina cf. delphinae)]